jgi:hypothetical protein
MTRLNSPSSPVLLHVAMRQLQWHAEAEPRTLSPAWNLKKEKNPDKKCRLPSNVC